MNLTQDLSKIENLLLDIRNDITESKEDDNYRDSALHKIDDISDIIKKMKKSKGDSTNIFDPHLKFRKFKGLVS